MQTKAYLPLLLDRPAGKMRSSAARHTRAVDRDALHPAEVQRCTWIARVVRHSRSAYKTRLAVLCGSFILRYGAVAVSPAATDAAGVSSKVSADTKKPVMNGTSSSSVFLSLVRAGRRLSSCSYRGADLQDFRVRPRSRSFRCLERVAQYIIASLGFSSITSGCSPRVALYTQATIRNTGTKIADTLQVSF